MGKLCAVDLTVAGSSPAGQLLIFFHNVFQVLTKTLGRHSSLLPRSRIKASVRKLRRCSPQPSATLLHVKDDVYFQANEFFDEIIHLGTNVRQPAD